MHLSTIHLRRFRNHADTRLEFGPTANVLVGDNAQGKTNVLEAISYLCLTKSFFAGADTHVMQLGTDGFEIEGTMCSGEGERRIRIAYDHRREERAYLLDGGRVEVISDVVGRFPIVVCSPEHVPVTTGGPAERRRLLDLVIAQSSPKYLRDLLDYRKALRQRNRVLLDAKLTRRSPAELLAPWDEQVVSSGASLMTRRKQFVAEFRPVIATAYRRISGDEEIPDLAYVPGTTLGDASTAAECASAFAENLRARRDDELRYGTTLEGPHRDEVAMTVNGLDLRRFASQGQHKTFLVSLKIGEFYYLRERCADAPIMLLDDIFSELDDRRSARLLAFVESLSQSFVTSTTAHPFEEWIAGREGGRMFSVRGGSAADYDGGVAA